MSKILNRRFFLPWFFWYLESSLFSLYLPPQVNDTTANAPVTGESGGAVGVTDITTSEPPSEGAALEEAAAYGGTPAAYHI